MDTLKSKSFVSAFVMVLVMLLVAVVPQLEGTEEVLIQNLTFVIVTLVIGHKTKDIVIAVGTKSDTTGTALEAVIEKTSA